MTFFAADGSWNISVVSGNSLVGRFAANGSTNVVVSDGTAGKGLYHKSGALRVTEALGTNGTGRYAKDGSLLVSTTGAYNAQKVTVVAGSLDVTAPTITSASTDSVAENATLSHALTASETVTWSIVGGADQTRFEISGSTLRWASNGTKDYEAPNDANTDNVYVVTVRATDLASNTTDQTISVTVTDVAEGYRYWRLLVSATDTGQTSTNIAELEFKTALAGADRTGSGTAAVSGVLSGFANAPFDNDPNTEWHSAAGVLPAWVSYDFGVGQALAIIQITIQAHPSNAAYSPKDFKIQHSVDNAAWVDEWSVTGSTGWAGGEIRTFTHP